MPAPGSRLSGLKLMNEYSARRKLTRVTVKSKILSRQSFGRQDGRSGRIDGGKLFDVESNIWKVEKLSRRKPELTEIGWRPRIFPACGNLYLFA